MKTALDVLQMFSWPFFAFAGFVVFICVFRSPLRLMLGRISAIGKNGVRMEMVAQVQDEEAIRKKNIDDLMNIGNPPLLKETEDLILKDLGNRKMDADNATVKVLVRHLAATRLLLDFEQIYNTIFGSQIRLLKRLNEVTGSGRAREYVQEYFEMVKIAFDPISNWTIDTYLNFLFSSKLLTVEGENYHITVKGVDFLVWLARTGKQEDRAG